MRTTTKRRAGQLALVTVAAPVAAWALEQAARRAEAGDKTSSTSRRLRQDADLVQRFGRGPLADRLRQRPVPPSPGASHSLNPTSIVVHRRPWPQGRVRGFTAATPRGRRPRNPAHPRLRRTGKRSLALMTGLRDGRMVSQLR
jgi:hypothetical protein